MAVCATGKGAMQLFNVAADGEISHISTINHVHTDSVRELATQEGQSGLVASVGQKHVHDSLCVKDDFHTMHLTQLALM